jgi:hypothetical protein
LLNEEFLQKLSVIPRILMADVLAENLKTKTKDLRQIIAQANFSCCKVSDLSR